MGVVVGQVAYKAILCWAGLLAGLLHKLYLFGIDHCRHIRKRNLTCLRWSKLFIIDLRPLFLIDPRPLRPTLLNLYCDDEI